MQSSETLAERLGLRALFLQFCTVVLVDRGAHGNGGGGDGGDGGDGGGGSGAGSGTLDGDFQWHHDDGDDNDDEASCHRSYRSCSLGGCDLLEMLGFPTRLLEDSCLLCRWSSRSSARRK